MHCGACALDSERAATQLRREAMTCELLCTGLGGGKGGSAEAGEGGQEVAAARRLLCRDGEERRAHGAREVAAHARAAADR